MKLIYILVDYSAIVKLRNENPSVKEQKEGMYAIMKVLKTYNGKKSVNK